MARQVKDQMQRSVIVNDSILKIICLVPSITELLFDLGLGEKIVGITKFCIHPDHGLEGKTVVGGTKRVHLDKVEALCPDLIIANKEENSRHEIEYLMERFPVWMSDINDLNGAMDMITYLGRLFQRKEESDQMVSRIEQSFTKLYAAQSRPKVMYLIWNDPWMSVGSDTFVHDMLSRCGFENVIKKQRYPVLSKEELIDLNPGIVLLSSEPFPFQEKHRLTIQSILPRAKIRFVDGELFSWYGSRLLYSAGYFRELVDDISE